MQVLKFKHIMLFMLMALGGLSCFRQESPMATPEPYWETIVNNKNHAQVFYNLKAQSVVHTNALDDWDLAFACDKGKFEIMLNSARGMGYYKTEETQFFPLYSLKGIEWEYNHNTPNATMNCISDWGDLNFESPQSYQNIYLIALNNHREIVNNKDFLQFKVKGFEKNAYYIQWANIDGTNAQEIFIPKNSEFNNIYFKFRGKGEILTAEPPKTDWDLMFSNTVVYNHNTNDYPPGTILTLKENHILTNSILINPYQHKVGVDTNANITDFYYRNILNFEFTENPQFISDSWRDQNTNYSMVKTKPNRVYVVQDNESNSFALQFMNYEGKTTYDCQTSFILKYL